MIFIDAIVVKIPDGQVANRPIYAAIGVTLAGEKDVPGLWADTGGEGAKFWPSVLTDIKNRGVTDTFFLVCGGLKGLPDVVGNVWPRTTVQTCIIHLIRNTFRLASKKDWDALKRDVKPIYSAPNPAAARAALDDLTDRWGTRYGAIIRLWEPAWEEFVPFLDYDRAGRVEVLASCDQVARPDRSRTDPMDDALEAALNAFAITFVDRWPAAETYSIKPPETLLLKQTGHF